FKGLIMQKNFEEGEVILIDKPLEWTSFDVVKKIRNSIKVKKIGHAGTLDPLATGLLILCTGKFTKKINDYMGMEKEYTGTMLLGRTTPSYDLETDFNSEVDTSHLRPDQISSATEVFKGAISQVPPVYSAIRVDGERLYKKARKGETVEIRAREVFIQAFEITGFQLPEVSFRIVCSKGTYIRSLVHDFGAQLSVGACLTSLRRTKIGSFSVEESEDLLTFVEEHRRIRPLKKENQ